VAPGLTLAATILASAWERYGTQAGPRGVLAGGPTTDEPTRLMTAPKPT